ncbi:MAG: protein translocase subunit SecF [Legionellales bacterium]|nr:protein translocase subunit SecF [Legionellales bacterium]
MEFFNPNSRIDFMGVRKWTALVSIVLLLGSISVLLVKGLNWGLDFTGGTQIEMHFAQTADLPAIRAALTQAGFSEAQVVSYGTSSDVLVSLAPKADLEHAAMMQQIIQLLPEAEIRRVEFVGPQVGQELATKGALAIVVSMIAIMIYVALRFEYRFAISAIVALIHDPILILGIFSLWQIEFDLKVLAAVLAVIGYSLNDTIVVFDRVRENFRKIRHASVMEIMNLSINQTLSRTIMTSALTLVVVVVLFLYGGETIRGFSLALIIGVVFGTYSSIYVAGALSLVLGLKRSDLAPSKKVADERP